MSFPTFGRFNRVKNQYKTNRDNCNTLNYSMVRYRVGSFKNASHLYFPPLDVKVGSILNMVLRPFWNTFIKGFKIAYSIIHSFAGFKQFKNYIASGFILI